MSSKEVKHFDDGRISEVYKSIKQTIDEARSKVYSSVNFYMVQAYWNIGRLIFEAQDGKERAEYGEQLIKNLSKELTKEFGKGFTPTNLKTMRKFYMVFQNSHALRDQLSWTHYRLLLKVDDNNKRDFYIDECIKSNWSTRQLERQINSFYYERLLSTQESNKEEVRNEIKELEPSKNINDMVKDPYILEFLNLKENKKFLERDLEQGLIDNLQEFLLELGKGFSFVGRQRRITADGEHFYVDLVFYNYLLKCFVLIDLKLGKLTHQDIGQMDFYVRYYEKEVKGEDDNPTIGIILCSEKNETIVKYSILEESKQIFASKYMLYMPTEEELKREINKDREILELEERMHEDE
ncbi:PDDEXK nuclease domain-containing protein [Clostridium sp. ZS2-4]|uniref:PDDEXK nuclease domain-containing protein n=1 Tax=Clostridium sp. ZS2-4 TaxID=2987703 RepID=UPI00227B2E3E|nr:PDDEXK nuclease domain-containing protein [Clostridium sp. ZS2-4]MCY6354379.1 PDDEXK nuclease domain-containing protein [Clostridium sp. ZS2-4]